jgi:opacity protein-like surface antigen
MSKLLFACIVAAAAFAGPVRAADMAVKAPPAPVDPAYNWSGFYVGAHFGYLWGRTTVWDTGVLTDSGAPTNGVVGGILAGYNYQTGPLVFGVSADIGWSNAHGVGVNSNPVEAPNLYNINWTSHFLGQVGYANGPWMIFVAGGLAIMDFKFQNGEAATTATGAKFTGPSIGGGVAYQFNKNLFGVLQYLYDDYGNKTYTVGPGDFYKVAVTGSTLRAALDWRFP